MPTLVEGPQLSAAGLARGRLAFQEFLLAGERHVVAGLRRPGAEAAFAAAFATLSEDQKGVFTGYFNRQSRLSLVQRRALLGDLVNLRISQALAPGRLVDLGARSPLIRAELDALGDGRFGRGSGGFRTITGSAAAAIDDAVVADPAVAVAAPPTAGRAAVRRIDLLLRAVHVEASQDETFWQDDVDEVTVGVTMIDEFCRVSTTRHDLASIEEGNGRVFDPPLTLGTIPVATSTDRFPRVYHFKIDAVERDDGGYNQALASGAQYLHEKITEELIALGIIRAGQAIGIPVPPIIANYIASFIKGWFDDFIDWLVGLLKNEDDLVGSTLVRVELTSSDFTLIERNLFTGTRTLHAEHGPLRGSATTRVLAGNDGRWMFTLQPQLR